jgi:FAD/FMN-containing dehydrogenase
MLVPNLTTFLHLYTLVRPFAFPARFDEARKWCTDLKLALQPTSIGVYGQLSDDKASSKSSSPLAEASTDDDAYAHDYQHRVWGDNYAKLQKAKKKFDPKNLFSSNENVKPAA